MKKIMMLVSISVIALPACPVSAKVAFEGDVGVSGVSTTVDGNNAKFNEYRDIRDGLYTDLWLKYDTDNFFIKGTAKDIGYDTQKYELEGGIFGSFKGYIDYSEVPHNFTFGARTFYSGAGTNHLNFTPLPVSQSPTPIPSVSNWNNFDYSTKRQTVELGFSAEKWKPFFFEFSAPHEEKTGTYPLGVAMGSNVTPGSSFVEIPQPIDYQTNALNMVAGYVKNPYFAAVSVFYSQFDNANSTLYFDRLTTRTGSTALGSSVTQDAFSLPPDNEAYKVAFKGSVKLPFNSQFSANLATGRMTADDNILLASTASFGGVFHGKVDTNNLDFVLTSNPIHLINSKIYFKYNERRNESDQLTTGTGTSVATNTLLGYEKTKLGIDLGWNLPAKFKLDTGYSYMSMTRHPSDFITEDTIVLPETRDNSLSAELKYRGFDFMTPKIGYTWLKRTADDVFFKDTDADPSIDVETFVWRYDVAPKTQNTLKASVDINPLTNLNLNVGYKYIDVNYSDTILGLRNTRSNQVNMDVGYTLGKMAKFNAYYDLELKKNYQFQRTVASLTANPPGIADPSIQNNTNFNWDVTFKDNSYSWGVGSEIYLMPKTLSLLLQYDNVNSNGNADFTYLFASALTGGRNNDNIDMANWDDYRLSAYSIKLRYTTASQYTFTVGYAYEYYKYNSAQFDNYLMVQGTNYLTGAYANPNYDAQVFFVAVDYKF